MLKDRRQAISDIIEQHGEISLHELEALFPEVSSMTLRRDIDFLEHEHKLVKIKGGAMSLTQLSRSVLQNAEGDYAQREFLNSDGKRSIAELAAPYAEAGRSIFIDAGSTMMQLARLLHSGRFSVVTNGVNISVELSQNKSATVNLVGGELNRNNMCVSGAGALEHLRNINIDIAFMAASGYTAEDGFTNGSYYEYELKRHVVQKAKKTIVLMDTSKIGKTMTYTFCRPEDVDILILDKKPDSALLKTAKETGMKILY